MQASRFARARKLILLHKRHMITTTPTAMITPPSVAAGVNQIFTRQISFTRRPTTWQLSRASPSFFKHLNAFVSDFSPTPPPHHKPAVISIYLFIMFILLMFIISIIVIDYSYYYVFNRRLLMALHYCPLVQVEVGAIIIVMLMVPKMAPFLKK